MSCVNSEGDSLLAEAVASDEEVHSQSSSQDSFAAAGELVEPVIGTPELTAARFQNDTKDKGWSLNNRLSFVCVIS